MPGRNGIGWRAPVGIALSSIAGYITAIAHSNTNYSVRLSVHYLKEGVFSVKKKFSKCLENKITRNTDPVMMNATAMSRAVPWLSGQSPASYQGGPSSIPDQSMWGL
jgi:hypothetical protein